jgi:putative ABC transport system substrate-binding protein
MSICLRRREFITLLGGAAAWPLAARAQQRAMPVIGYLSGRSEASDASMLVSARGGLGDIGFAECRNLAIEYRFADGQPDRVPALFMELTGRQVAVMVIAGAGGEDVWRLMRPSQIPIVYVTGADFVRAGLVSSYNRPGGNITGNMGFIHELTPKRLGLLRDLVPNAKKIGLLEDSWGQQAKEEDSEAAARLGLQVLFLSANTESEIEAAFAEMNQQRADALLLRTSPFFVTRARQITARAARHGLPALYPRREFAERGGLMSYNSSSNEAYRGAGRYAGRILKGDKPADLPVFRPTRFELVINLKAAKAINFEIPHLVRALADEIIE